MIEPYYQDNMVTIYHGDCAEIVPELGRFDLLLTDPPYGIGISSNPIRQAHEKMDWDNATPANSLIALCVDSCKRAIVWGGNYFGLPPCQKFLVWDKKQPENFSLSMAEMAWTNIPGPAKLYSYHPAQYHKSHPTQKPDGLMEWCIRQAGGAESILDPFMGSGTTLVAARRNGIRSVGIDREEKYCEIAARRVSQMSLFEA